MAILSRQIGWGQEENLIYEIISQMNKLNSQLVGNQSGFKVPVSRQIGWSTKEILLYEWLRETCKLTEHNANCCQVG